MAYTTDLHHKKNPYPGMMFTDPADNTDGDWVKYGCYEHVDYTNENINEDVFVGILTGDAEKVKAVTGIENPKVLAAGPEDTVFTYFIDHGDDGLIIIGDSYVSAITVMYAIETAHEKQLYGKWLWFMEACYSGSVFKTLPSDWNIFVMTSADGNHEADMNNCPPDDVIAGVELNTCLSGLWDNTYLDYAEQHPDCTIGEIVDAVHEEVSKVSQQNVSQWGDMSFRDMKLSTFIGFPSHSLHHQHKQSGQVVSLSNVPAHIAMWKAIRAEDKKQLDSTLQEYQQIVYENAKKEIEVMRLGRMILNEKATDQAMKTSFSSYSTDCVRDLTLSLIKNCGHTIPFSSSATNLIRGICRPGVSTPNVDFSSICL